MKYSHRQQDTYRQVARLHGRIANQRPDFLHQVSHRWVSEHDLMAIEDLSLSFINRNGHLSLSAHDAMIGRLRQLLEYKAKSASISVVAVNPSHTAQACSGCGSMVATGLFVRVHACPDCGLVLNRDVNAARNILKIAEQISLGRSGQLGTWAVTPSVG